MKATGIYLTVICGSWLPAVGVCTHHNLRINNVLLRFFLGGGLDKIIWSLKVAPNAPTCWGIYFQYYMSHFRLYFSGNLRFRINVGNLNFIWLYCFNELPEKYNLKRDQDRAECEWTSTSKLINQLCEGKIFCKKFFLSEAIYSCKL